MYLLALLSQLRPKVSHVWKLKESYQWWYNEGTSFSLRMEWTQTVYDAPGYGSLVSGAIMTLFNILLFVGASEGKRSFFLPWLIVKMIGIIGAYILAGYFLVIGNLINLLNHWQLLMQAPNSIKISMP